jgi:hypothetical protein
MTYNWATDAKACWDLAIRMKALRIGSRRAATPWEFYWLEGQGLIP